MIKNQPAILVLFSLSVLIFSACGKEGPAGAQGPAGPQGATGQTGATGSQGPAGTANVIYSRWTSGSTWTSDPSTGLAFYNIPATSLTQSILSGGSLHVYWAVLGDTVNNVRALPFIETVGADIYFHNPKYSVGNVRVETNNLSMSTANRYRYILIPGAVLGGRIYTDINFNNYNEVLNRLNIPH